MSGISQRSYEVRDGKYQNGDALIQGYGDYNPTNVLITKAANTSFIADVGSKNVRVVSRGLTLTDLREQRRPLAFKLKNGGDINCLENRIRNILQYVMGDLPGQKAGIKKLKEICKKLSPKYPKKADPNLPRGTGKSPSEKSFNSLVGFGNEVIGIITGIGPDYAPTNTNIQIADLTVFVSMLNTMNRDIATAEEAYGNAVRERKEIYDGEDGMSKRISMIKSYLAGFEGGKNSAHYIEFSQAVK